MWWAEHWIADRSGPIGSERSLDSYGKWANTSNVPFRRFKGDTYEGGIITPFIVHWPARVEPGMITGYPGHVIDIMPTLLDATGTKYPERYNGRDILPPEGHSLLPLVLESDADMTEPELYWEHFGDKAVRLGDWKLVRGKEEDGWNLYDLSDDPTELNDLSGTYPDRVADMERKYQAWSDRVGALPDSVYNDLVLVRNADWFESGE
jgi:arylsulfatase